MFDKNYNYKIHLIVMIISILIGIKFGLWGAKLWENPYGSATSEIFEKEPELAKSYKYLAQGMKFGLPFIFSGFINGLYFEFRYLKKIKPKGILKKIIMFELCYFIFVPAGVIFLIPSVIYDIYKLFFNKNILKS